MDEKPQPPQPAGGTSGKQSDAPSPNDLSALMGLDDEDAGQGSGLKLRGPGEPRKPQDFEADTAGPPPDFDDMESHGLKALEGQQLQAPSVEAVAGKGYRTSTKLASMLEDDIPMTEQEEIQEFNGRVSPDHVLNEMGFKGDAVLKEKGSIRIFCPIHHDQIRRSMSIDPETRTYQCTLKSCPGYKGGTLVELYAIHFDVSPMEARRRLSGGSMEVQVSEYALVEEATTYIESGRYEEALPILQKAVEAAPKNETTRCRLAALQLEMGRRDEGVSNYLIAAEDYGVRGELEKTLQIYNLLVMMSPNDYESHEQMAYIAARLGNVDEAVEKLKWLCNAMIEADRLDQAIVRVDRMIELKPEHTPFLEMKADLLAANGHLNEAESHVAWAIQELVKRGSVAGAYRLAQKGLAISPSNQLLQLLNHEVEGELTKQGLNLQAFNMPAIEEEEEEDDAEFNAWIAELEDEMEESKSRRQALSGSFAFVDTKDESLRTPPRSETPQPAPNLTPPPVDAAEFLEATGGGIQSADSSILSEQQAKESPHAAAPEPQGAWKPPVPPKPVQQQPAQPPTEAPDPVMEAAPAPPAAVATSQLPPSVPETADEGDSKPIPTSGTMPQPQPTGELPVDDQRVEMARGQLSKASSEERMLMYAHLRQMYHDVKKSHEDGTLTDFEKKVIKDFYKSFCIAFKESNAEAGGDTLLTKF